MNNRRLNLHRIFLCVAASVLALATIAATSQPAVTPPTTRPTAEQQLVLDRIRSQPPDEAMEKLDVKPLKKDGTPNENFGKRDQTFEKKHEANLARAKSGPIDLLFLGDSITDWFTTNGKDVWKRYDAMNAADFGILGDRTEHVLWRIDNGELDGIRPKVVVLMIGTNNIGGKPDQIIAADTKIVREIHDKIPTAKVLLMGILTRGKDPTKDNVDKRLREKVKQVNDGLAKLDDGSRTRFLDIDDKFIGPDGLMLTDLLPDGVHPSEKGYAVWADAMQPLLDEMMK